MCLIFCFLRVLIKGGKMYFPLFFVFGLSRAFSIPPVYFGFSLFLLIYFACLPIKKKKKTFIILLSFLCMGFFWSFLKISLR